MDTKAQFTRDFLYIDGPNKADIRAYETAKREGRKTHHIQKHDPSRKRPDRLIRQSVRNDLAHLDIIRKPKSIQLTYVMNAVRGLMAYDQKQKNAIPKSIKRILQDEGLAIDWKINEDRLLRPEVSPLIEQHLKMVNRRDFPDASFAIPRASVRLVSMVQALFDFGNSGLAIEHPKTRPETVLLRYPDVFFAQQGVLQEAIREVTNVKFAYIKT